MPDDIINKVMNFISRDSDSDSDKDILLKQLSKEIAQNKYTKFYRVRQMEADASFGQYIFSIYKIIYPIQVFFRDPAKESRLKQVTLEAFLDKKTLDTIKRLTPEVIAERKKNANEDLSKTLQEDLTALAAGFDSPKIAIADKCNNLIASMRQFALFDYYSLLRKFDPEIMEGEFLSQPKFSPVDIKLMVSELSLFLSILPLTEERDSVAELNNWKSVFEILKYCKGGTEVLPFNQWNSLLVSLKDLKQSRIIELMVRLATGNPVLEIKPNIPREAMSATWLELKTSEIREIITGIVDNQRVIQINAMEQAVFGPLATNRLDYYIPDRATVLLDKGILGYIFARALNHLEAFIEEYIGKEIQELCDILLVRGQWTNNTSSRQMSDAYHTIVEIEKEIMALDETLAEEGSNGPRIRGALLRIDRDKSQARYLTSIVESINDEALDIINRAVPALIVVGKNFKLLMDDYDKKPFELMMNWKELASYSKAPINQRIAAAYKKINYFVQLMLLETRYLEE